MIVPGNPVETRTRGSILARAVRAGRCARELIAGRSVGGVASRVVGRSRTVVDAEYLEPPGLAGSPRGCVPVPGRANHRGEPRRSPRATPQPGPRSPPVPSREGRTRGVGGLSSRDAVRRCDGRGARRHRRRRRHRHRGRARGTPIRPCVSRARALSDARRVVEIQQRRGQSPGISVQKNPAANRKLENLARCADLSSPVMDLAAVSKRPEVSSCRVGAAGGCQEVVRAGSPSGRTPAPRRRDATRASFQTQTRRAMNPGPGLHMRRRLGRFGAPGHPETCVYDWKEPQNVITLLWGGLGSRLASSHDATRTTRRHPTVSVIRRVSIQTHTHRGFPHEPRREHRVEHSVERSDFPRWLFLVI